MCVYFILYLIKCRVTHDDSGVGVECNLIRFDEILLLISFLLQLNGFCVLKYVNI